MWVFNGATQAWTHDFAAGFSTSCNGNAVTFTASDVIAGGDGIMNPARGYFMPGAVTSSKSFTGDINNGPYSFPISSTNLGNQPNWSDDDWNLVGNPYPSAISATAFWNENAVNNNRITDAIYFWDDGNTVTGYSQNSDYATWNLLGGVNSGNSAITPNGFISSGQGFWVVASSTTNLVFNNSMRAETNSQFFKQSKSTENHNAWFSFTSPSNYQNNILVGYNQQTTDSEDRGYDAHKLLGNAHIRFASYIGTDEFVIQSIAPLAIGSSKTIALVVTSDETGTHIFSGYKRENIPAEFKIYLRDKVLGIDFDLSSGNYHVDLEANQEYTTRFKLVFKNEIQITGGGSGSKGGSGNPDSTVTSITTSNPKSLFVLATTPNGYVLSNQDGFTGDILILDLTGKTVWTKTNLDKTNSITISLKGISSGMYILELRNNSERIYQNKILKQ